jgi:tRNA (guanine-N7-)-methyltransferase
VAAVTDRSALDGLLVDPTVVGFPLTAAALFARDCPLEVEIGVGKGRFLLEWASAHPEIGLLGVERARPYLTIAAMRAARRGLINVRLVHTTAEDLLFRLLASDSVAAVHVYYPDPWPKKRHAKRRFFRTENLARLADVLSPGGLLLVKTDHDGYAATIEEMLRGEPRLAAVATVDAIPDIGYEAKYAREGRTVHRFVFRKGAREGR